LERGLSFAGQAFRAVARRIPPALARSFGRPAALFFHGVEREIFDSELQFNHHGLDDFLEIITVLKRDFDVAPIGDLCHVLKRPERHPRTVFLMADDGYANNLSVAADVLEDAGLPWTLFVSTEHIDSGAMNPMFVARAFLKFAPPGGYRIPHLSDELQLTADRCVAASKCLRDLKLLPAGSAREAVAAMIEALREARLPDALERYGSEQFLDWNGVRSLAARGVTIGAHAHFHWPLHADEDPEFLKRQAEMPKQRIEAEVGPCRVFAYPFGNDQDICAAGWHGVRDAGYDFAFTTMSGALDASRNPWLLPRYGLSSREPNLAGLVPLLRLGNGRISRWQAALA
jgi:peptidoglycan/xylan/chitin deacetylase (PgdA/CDA1 family)